MCINVSIKNFFFQDQKIYDEPCEVSRPPTPEVPKTEFQKLRQSFENASQKVAMSKPVTLPPKPILSKKVWKSTENVSDDFRTAKRAVEKKFATEIKRYKKNEAKTMFSLPKKETQLDVDRENVSMVFVLPIF